MPIMSVQSDVAETSYSPLYDDNGGTSKNAAPSRSSSTRFLSFITLGFTSHTPPNTDNSPDARHARLLLVLRAAVGELLATCTLVFLTCTAGLVCFLLDLAHGPAVLLNALTAGLTVTSCIYSWYSICGAHMNPAITLSLLFTSHISVRRAALYILAQLAGGQLAMALLGATFYAQSNRWSLVALRPMTISAGGEEGAASHSAPLLSVFCTELLGTFILVLTNFKAAVDQVTEEVEDEGGDADEEALQRAAAEDQQEEDGFRVVARARGGRGGRGAGGLGRDIRASRLPVVPIALAMGATVAVLVGVGQASSGGAYNAVRYLSTAVWSGVWEGWWCWLVAQMLGCAVACVVHVALDRLAAQAMQLRRRAIDTRRRARTRKPHPPDDAEEQKASPA